MNDHAPQAILSRSALPTLPHQQTAFAPIVRTRSQKATQFFIGLAVGLVGVPVFAGFVNQLALALFPASAPLIEVIFGGLPLVAGIILTVRSPHRFLGLGLLTAILLLAFIGFSLLFLFILLFSQYCSQHGPAACG